MTSTIGIPIKLLNEAAVCYSKTGPWSCLLLTAHRAILSPSRSRPVRCTAASSSKVRLLQPLSPHVSANSVTAEDNMNVQLKDITVTARDGRVSHLEQVYIRGSHVRYFIVPDMLRCASTEREAAAC
jgi:hypothetical protein